MRTWVLALLFLATMATLAWALVGCEETANQTPATAVPQLDASGQPVPTADLAALPADGRQAVLELLRQSTFLRDNHYVATSVTLERFGDVMCGRGHRTTADRREVWAVVLVGPFPGDGSVPHGYLSGAPTPSPPPGSRTVLALLDCATGTSLQTLSPWPQPRDPAVRC